MADTLLNFVNQFGNPAMVGIVRKWTQASVLMRILNFISVDGFDFTYNEEVAAPGISYRALNENYSDQSAGVVSPKVETMAIFGGVAKTDVEMVNKQGARSRATQIARRQEATAKYYDHEVAKGAGSTNPKAIAGMYARLQNDQLLTNATDGAVVSYKKVLDLLDAVYGRNSEKVLLLNKTTRRGLIDDLAASAGGLKISDYAGEPIETFDGARLEVFDEDEEEDPVFTFDETCGASSVCTSMICIHPGSTTDREGVQGLTGSGGITIQDLGYSGVQRQDLVEAHMGIGIFHGRAAARLQGILAA